LAVQTLLKLMLHMHVTFFMNALSRLWCVLLYLKVWQVRKYP